MSYLPERPYLADWMTVSQLLDFFCDFYANFDRGAAEKMLMALQISPKLRIKQMSQGHAREGAAHPRDEPPRAAVPAR